MFRITLQTGKRKQNLLKTNKNENSLSWTFLIIFRSPNIRTEYEKSVQNHLLVIVNVLRLIKGADRLRYFLKWKIGIKSDNHAKCHYLRSIHLPFFFLGFSHRFFYRLISKLVKLFMHKSGKKRLSMNHVVRAFLCH